MRIGKKNKKYTLVINNKYSKLLIKINIKKPKLYVL